MNKELPAEIIRQIEQDAQKLTAKYNTDSDYQAGYCQGVIDGYEQGGAAFASKYLEEKQRADIYEKYLTAMANPIAWLQEKAKEEGDQLDGIGGKALSNNREFYRAFADEALSAYREGIDRPETK